MDKKSLDVRLIILFVALSLFMANLAKGQTVMPYGDLRNVTIIGFSRSSFTLRYDILLFNETATARLYVLKPWKEAALGEGYTNVTDFDGATFHIETELDNNTIQEAFPYLNVTCTFYLASTVFIVGHDKQVEIEGYEGRISYVAISAQEFDNEALQPMEWNGSSMTYNFMYSLVCQVQRTQQTISDFEAFRQNYWVLSVCILIAFLSFTVVFISGKLNDTIYFALIAVPFFGASLTLGVTFNNWGTLQPPPLEWTNLFLLTETVFMPIVAVLAWQFKRKKKRGSGSRSSSRKIGERKHRSR